MNRALLSDDEGRDTLLERVKEIALDFRYDNDLPELNAALRERHFAPAASP